MDGNQDLWCFGAFLFFLHYIVISSSCVTYHCFFLMNSVLHTWVSAGSRLGGLARSVLGEMRRAWEGTGFPPFWVSFFFSSLMPLLPPFPIEDLETLLCSIFSSWHISPSTFFGLFGGWRPSGEIIMHLR